MGKENKEKNGTVSMHRVEIACLLAPKHKGMSKSG